MATTHPRFLLWAFGALSRHLDERLMTATLNPEPRLLRAVSGAELPILGMGVPVVAKARDLVIRPTPPGLALCAPNGPQVPARAGNHAG